MAQLKDALIVGDARVLGDFYSTSPKVAYGTCVTAAATAAKVITIDDPTWTLQIGDVIGVKYTYSNSASSCTLNVNSSGAKQVWYNTSIYTGTSSMIVGYANRYIYYIYDGTYWVWLSHGCDNNDNTYTSAYCSTAAGTAAKTASQTNYILTANTYTYINIVNANTSASALTLNINGKGAKPIYINGSASSTSNYTLPAGTYLIFYNGTNYYFRTDGASTVGTSAISTSDITTWNNKENSSNKSSSYTTSSTTTFPNTKALVDGLATKQATLVSGTNIKTINSTSLLGSGNINIFDAIYPVNSIYMSVSSTNPGTLFGGTWTQLKDRFLLGAGDSYTAGNTGGYTALQAHTHSMSFTSGNNNVGHTHSIGAHAHGLNSHTHSIPALSGSTSTTGTHTHTVTSCTTSYASGSQWSWRCLSWSGTSHDYSDTVYTNAGTADGGHSHDITTTASTTGAASGSTAASSAFTSGGISANHTHSISGTTASTGSGAASTATDGNMPPYLVVYMWKRTA